MARLYRVSFLAGRPASRGMVVRLPMTSAEACLTRTLICIIAMSIFLVTPSELVNLYFYAARPTDGQSLRAAIVVTNALQTANFSFNFVLYLVVNAQFRSAVAESCRCPALLGPCCRKPPTAELLELGYPLTVATAAATGGSVAVELATASASQEGRLEQTFNKVAVEVNHTDQTAVWIRRDEDDDEQSDDQY